MSDTITSSYDSSPAAIISVLRAKHFDVSFTRQKNTVQGMYGKQLDIARFTQNEIMEKLQPLLEYYPERDRGYIVDRVVECVMTMQKKISIDECKASLCERYFKSLGGDE